MTTVQLGDADNGTRISVGLGDRILIQLEESGGGYLWAVDYLDQMIVRPQQPDRRPGGGAIGGANVVEFSFHAKGRGTTPIALKLWRDWVGDASILQRYTVTLDID